MTAERRAIPVALTDDAPARWCGLADDPVADDGVRCARCGEVAEGFAERDGRRLCHPDVGPSCYEAEACGVDASPLVLVLGLAPEVW